MPGPARVALITGGARGIGRVTAMRLLADGYCVAFTYTHSHDAATDFTNIDPKRIFACHGDIRDDARNREIVQDIIDNFGAIDALVNNAGIRRDALMHSMTHDQWDDVLATDLGGTHSMTQIVLPVMMRQGGGSIVNVVAVSGLHGAVGQTNYAAAKGAVIAMTRSLAREVAHSGIRVNCVAPGFVDTDMVAGVATEVKNHIIAAVPMRRAIRADEVAAAIAFLLGDEASGITGQTLCVDGGSSA